MMLARALRGRAVRGAHAVWASAPGFPKVRRNAVRWAPPAAAAAGPGSLVGVSGALGAPHHRSMWTHAMWAGTCVRGGQPQPAHRHQHDVRLPLPQRRRLASAAGKFPRFNNEITAETVRVLDAAGEQVGVMTKSTAMEYAKERGLDVVQFSSMNEPVVVKVMDWHKEQRAMRQRKNQRKREAAQRERERAAEQKKMKKMSFSARIADHDLHVKTSKMVKMLAKNHGIKISVAFQGPEPWRIQEEKRRAVVGRLMDEIGDAAQWLPNTLKADHFQLHLQIRPNPKPTEQTAQRAAQMREALQHPIWPAAVAKAEAARASQAAAAAAAANEAANAAAADADGLSTDDDGDDAGDDLFADASRKRSARK